MDKRLEKIEAVALKLKSQMFGERADITDVMKNFEIQLELKNIACSYELKDIVIKCDRNWTIEAIQNIVKNCIEHMENGGKLHISSGETNIFSEIVIEDNGCGIEEEDLPHIFERFYKGKNAGKDSVGIGLALAKTIMNSQHGDILVTSIPGEGTKFNVRFYKTIV